MTDEHTITSRWYRTRGGQVLLGTVAITGVYLLVEHWAHAMTFLPWLLILACPLLHVFLHRGHGSHGDHAAHSGHGDPGAGSGRDDAGTPKPGA